MEHKRCKDSHDMKAEKLVQQKIGGYEILGVFVPFVIKSMADRICERLAEELRAAQSTCAHHEEAPQYMGPYDVMIIVQPGQLVISPAHEDNWSECQEALVMLIARVTEKLRNQTITNPAVLRKLAQDIETSIWAELLQRRLPGLTSEKLEGFAVRVVRPVPGHPEVLQDFFQE